jgi:hypothetical protein
MVSVAARPLTLNVGRLLLPGVLLGVRRAIVGVLGGIASIVTLEVDPSASERFPAMSVATPAAKVALRVPAPVHGPTVMLLEFPDPEIAKDSQDNVSD